MSEEILYKTITTLPSLAPSPKTNGAFSQLVTYCITNTNKKISLTSKQVQLMQKICARAETQMEMYWAKKSIDSVNPWGTINSFWYYKNYCELTDLEASHIQEVCPAKNILFVGGGPFPLSAIMFVKNNPLFTCTVLEKGYGAYTVSKKLIDVLGLNSKIKIIHSDICDYKEFVSHETIILASLVGETVQEKLKILTHVFTKIPSRTIILFRTSRGMRELLYPSISREALEKFNPIIEVHPTTSIINSFFILQKP